MKFYPSIKSFSLCFLLFSAVSFADSNKIEKYTWKKVSKAKTVKVSNPIGDIRLRFGGFEDEFEVIAMVQHLETVGKIRVKEVIENGAYELSVERYDKNTDQVIDLKQGDKSRVDFTVFVPIGRTIIAETDAGLAEARKMRDPVYLTTNSGQVFLRDNKNIIKAKTVSGEIIANLINIESDKEQSFTTETGLIDLWIAEDARQTVQLATSGDIISEFSTTMERDLSKEPNKQVTIKANGGGAKINASSKRGQIALRVYPPETK